jgi:hypothetical protein
MGHLLPRDRKAQKYLDEARDLFSTSMKGEPLTTDESMLRAAQLKARKSLLPDPSNYDAALLLGHIFPTMTIQDRANKRCVTMTLR